MTTMTLEGPVVDNTIAPLPEPIKTVPGNLLSKDAARMAFIAASNLVRSARKGVSRMIAQQIRALAAFLTFVEGGVVGNKEVADLLREGLDSAVLGVKAVIKQMDGSQTPEWFDKTTAYKQYATKYKALARWQNKTYSKAELEWIKDAEDRNKVLLGVADWKWDGSVVIGLAETGIRSYLDPVSALDAGETFTDVFKAWKDAVNPTHYNVGDYETNRGALKASQDKGFINALSVVLRVTPETGGPQRRKATKLISVGGAIEGTILGLLAHAPRAMLTKARLGRLAEAVEFYAAKYHNTADDDVPADEEA